MVRLSRGCQRRLFPKKKKKKKTFHFVIFNNLRDDRVPRIALNNSPDETKRDDENRKVGDRVIREKKKKKKIANRWMENIVLPSAFLSENIALLVLLPPPPPPPLPSPLDTFSSIIFPGHVYTRTRTYTHTRTRDCVNYTYWTNELYSYCYYD